MKSVAGIERGDYSKIHKLCQRKLSLRGESVTLSHVLRVLKGSRSCNPGTLGHEIMEIAKTYIATKKQIDTIIQNIT